MIWNIKVYHHLTFIVILFMTNVIVNIIKIPRLNDYYKFVSVSYSYIFYKAARYPIHGSKK